MNQYFVTVQSISNGTRIRYPVTCESPADAELDAERAYPNHTIINIEYVYTYKPAGK